MSTPPTTESIADHTQITLDLQVKDKLCLDLLTTAYEGGSAYWLACETLERDTESSVTKIIGCHDREDPEEKWPDADVATMRMGIKRILSGEVSCRKDIRSTVLAAVLDDDNTDWDAETADCVLQVGLLGSIVYG